MLRDKKILALIPARGGSKGIPRKNIVDLCGSPLIAHTILSSLKSIYIDSTVVSTDDEAIARIACKYGAEVPFLRPSSLAQDESTTISVVLHALERLDSMGRNYDTLVLLQPTQPLRTAEDIDGAIELFFETQELGVASVSLADDHPILIRTMGEGGILTPLLTGGSTCRRQDMPPFFKVNGCVYVNSVDSLCADTSFNDNPIGFLIDRDRSIDIDEPRDLIIAKMLYENRMSSIDGLPNKKRG